MDAVEAAIIIYVYCREMERNKKRKYKKKRYWIHPLLQTRCTNGMFFTFFHELKQYEEKFFGYLRMRIESFEELLQELGPYISGNDTNFRAAISPEEKLVVTLRYLASGCYFVDLHYTYRLGLTTITQIVRQVCAAIWIRLKDTWLPQPTEETWKDIANNFNKRANFPNCLGAIDGKHIRIIKPENSGSMCYNYKNYFSIVLLAICDSDYKFIAIDVGAYGKFGDSTIFKNSNFYKKLEQNTLDIPEASVVSPAIGTPLPYAFIGDEAFALSTHMMRPYGGKNLSKTKRIFNYRLSRARRYVECSFGILANKWRIFHRPLNVNTEFANSIVKACCILHNFVRTRDGYRFDDTLLCPLTDDLEPCENSRNNPRSAIRHRELLAEYFISEGSLEWQDRYA